MRLGQQFAGICNVRRRLLIGHEVLERLGVDRKKTAYVRNVGGARRRKP
jgi:hypothetical protein